METTNDDPREDWTWYDENILPLMQAKRNERVIEVMEAKLAEDISPEFRSMLMSTFSGFLTGTGRHAECLDLARRRVSTFPDDPFAWEELGSCLHFAFHQPDEQPTSEEKDEALYCWRHALEVARREQVGFREVSFSFCRALTEWRIWPELETVMRGILETVKEPCAQDTRDLQNDWLKKVPEGVIDGKLHRQYQAAVERHRLSTVLTFNALARDADGATSPFILRVRAPNEDAKGGVFCSILCPLLQKEPIRIYGVDDAQACELAISFIRNRLRDEGYEIVDEMGSVRVIPDIELKPDVSAKK